MHTKIQEKSDMLNLFKKKKKKKKPSKKDQLLALQLELANKEKALHQAVYDSLPSNVRKEFSLMDSLNKPLSKSPMFYNRNEVPLDEKPEPKRYMGDL